MGRGSAPARAGDRRQSGCTSLLRARAVEHVPLPRRRWYRQALTPDRPAQMVGAGWLRRGGCVLDAGWARAVWRAKAIVFLLIGQMLLITACALGLCIYVGW